MSSSTRWRLSDTCYIDDVILSDAIHRFAADGQCHSFAFDIECRLAMRKSRSIFILIRHNSARARLYPLRVEVKIQRLVPRGGLLRNSFIFIPNATRKSS